MRIQFLPGLIGHNPKGPCHESRGHRDRVNRRAGRQPACRPHGDWCHLSSWSRVHVIIARAACADPPLMCDGEHLAKSSFPRRRSRLLQGVLIPASLSEAGSGDAVFLISTRASLASAGWPSGLPGRRPCQHEVSLGQIPLWPLESMAVLPAVSRISNQPTNGSYQASRACRIPEPPGCRREPGIPHTRQMGCHIATPYNAKGFAIGL